jgi:uncharacterized membrane protein
MFTRTSRKTSTALLVSAILAFIIVTIALAAELITEKSTVPINEVALIRDESVEFDISIYATGAISCNVAADDPSTARVHTSFYISENGMVVSQDSSESLNFYSSGVPDPDPSTGNCGITWIDAPQPYIITATISSHPDAELGVYWIVLSPDAGTVQVTNPPSANKAKLTDNIATYIEVHLVDAEFGLMLEPDDETISGNPGEMVTYTLTLTNSGNTTDTFGIIFEGNLWEVHLGDDEFTLEAGESAAVNVQVTIPVEAMADEFDLVTITATSSGDPQISASTSLTTSANAVYDFIFEPEQNTLSGDPGSIVSYILNLTNTGNTPDTFNLMTTGNYWDVLLSATNIDLGAGESIELSVSVNIPADAMAGDSNTLNLIAMSAGDENISASSMLTTSTNAYFHLELTPEDEALSGAPGNSIAYNLSLSNTGNITDTFKLQVGESDWLVELNLDNYTLAAGNSVQVILLVIIPESTATGDASTTTITATSQGDVAVSDSISLTTTAVVETEPAHNNFNIFMPIINRG